MDLKKLNYYYSQFKYGEDNFHYLMQNRVREILLISTLYDAYTFEQESRLSQKLVGEYHELKLTTIPRITNVPTAEEAIEKLSEQHYDLVITTMRVAGLSAFELGRRIREADSEVPILLLLTNKADLSIVESRKAEMGCFENVFLWNGDSKLILAMIKYIEDKNNVGYDTSYGMVRVILLVEDSIDFYSIYLPALYKEIMLQTQRLISEELNDAQKYYRMRARPKVLCARSYEEAMAICRKYKEYMLCIISDICYEKEGNLHDQAGIGLIKMLKEEQWDIPILLQSSEMLDRQLAESLQVHFIHKYSPNLLFELKTFILENLGFGDFVFRNKRGEEIDRATSLADLERKIRLIPTESLLYHSKRNHFSAWLIAHGEFQVARKIKPIKDSDFPDTEMHRQFLVDIFNRTRNQQKKGKVIGFEKNSLTSDDVMIKMTEGSLGGKGRGLAFFNSIFATIDFNGYDKEVDIKVPKTFIIGTDEFDHYIEKNDLRFLMGSSSDEQVRQEFLQGELSPSLIEQLTDLLEVIKRPLAIRSSGLLEDSQSQPFAGIYDTYMIPNNHQSLSCRLVQLVTAIKLVYASVYLQNTKSYIEGLNCRLEEEKMAVVIQEIVGQESDGYYYPHFSGVAQSYNFYPTARLSHHEGVAMLAVGLGHHIVEGGRTHRFCPRHPEINYFSTEDQVRFTQTEAYALDMQYNSEEMSGDSMATLARLPVSAIEKHNNLRHLASVWDAANNRIDDGLNRPGPRVINFSNIIKYDVFPLSRILIDILDISEVAFGVPVEIEFAVDLTRSDNEGKKPAFYFLQVRPLTVNKEELQLNFEHVERKAIFLYTGEGMGHGIIQDLYDIVVVDPERFDKTKTGQVKKEIDYFNQKLKKENRRYILIGPGRWGSRDPHLGIPVEWGHISQARIIVEACTHDFNIEPSQGTHFFHNLIAMNVGYFYIPPGERGGFVDWQWLRSQKTMERKQFTFHIRGDSPFVVKMDGKKGKALIYKNQ
ncbi:MAG: PEP/pyruvate-binding domain-containing protein [Bacillota bacterium]|nr:PEP/pyruvate-binding domain-containing protein [Bacillota bacterium]